MLKDKSIKDDFVNTLKFEYVTENEIDEVLNLYKNVIRTTLTTWDDNYPNRELLIKDINNKELFALKNNEIIAVAYISNYFESENASWKYNLKNPFRFARICTSPEYQGLGVGTKMLTEIINHVKSLGCDGLQIAVYIKNTAAIRLYEKFNFIKTGEKNEYGFDYFKYELKF